MSVRKVDVDTVFGIGFVQLLGFEDKLLEDRVVTGDHTVVSRNWLIGGAGYEEVVRERTYEIESISLPLEFFHRRTLSQSNRRNMGNQQSVNHTSNIDTPSRGKAVKSVQGPSWRSMPK